MVEACGAAPAALAAAAAAPLLRAGGAALYDYRLVHCGEANACAGPWEEGLRPLLQLVFRARAGGRVGWAEGSNFGAEALLTRAAEGEWAREAEGGAEAAAEAAEGGEWWRAAYFPEEEAAVEAAPAPTPTAAGWSVFD